MRTLVLLLTQDQFESIKTGKKNYIIGKFKQTPVAGQRLILQTPTDEITTTITDVHSEPGMIKHYSIVSFPAILQVEAISPVKIIFEDQPADIV